MKKILGKFAGNSEKTDKYSKLTDSDLIGSIDANTNICIVDVSSQNDLINAKEEIQEGNIVLADISYIDSNSISIEKVISELKEAVNIVDGDIAHRKKNKVIIATPTDVSVRREIL